MTATVGIIQNLVRHVAMDVSVLCNSLKLPLVQDMNHTIAMLIQNIMKQLASICFAMHFNPAEIITKKMNINKQKYNEKECKRNTSILKWTSFSNVSGIDKSTVLPQVFTPSKAETEKEVMDTLMDSFVAISTDIHAFAERRNWLNKYNEQSIALSLIAETGELAEIFQWREWSDSISQIDAKSLNDCAMEIADIYVYLFHLCRLIGADKATFQELSNP